MMRITYILILLLVSFSSLNAQIAQERSKLENLKKATLELINETSRMLTSTKKTAGQYLRDLNLLNTEISERQKLISTINSEVRLIDRERAQLTDEIKELEAELVVKRQKYAEAMRSLYSKKGNAEEIIFILSADNLSQSYRRMRYLHEYSTWRKQQAMTIIDKQKELEHKKSLLVIRKNEQLALLADRKKEADALAEKQAKQKGLVNNLNKKQKELQAELSKQQAQARSFDQQIQKLIEEEARLAAKKNNTTTTSKGGYAMTEKEYKLSGTFEKNKGKLPFPTDGSYVIVGRFGTQKHAQLKYVVTQNNGIDIQTKPGANARAVYEGVVSKVFIVPGYNSSVIIRHGNYLSVYSNLSEVNVKAGDKVKTAQPIGKIFTDKANGNVTQMQFQIWKEMTKLNPEPWLAK